MRDDILPLVTLSWAQSLDGRLATVTGDSQWIGGPESLRFAHELRRDNDAILVGVGTVLKDDPRLTCRIEGGRNPVRVILDSRLRTPPTSRVATSTAEARTIIFTGQETPREDARVLQDQGVEVIWVDEYDRRLDLSAVLHNLQLMEVGSVFVEGGATVLTSFLAQNLASRAIVVTSPFFIGEGVSAVGDLGSVVLASVPRPVSWRRWELGDDLATELVFR